MASKLLKIGRQNQLVSRRSIRFGYAVESGLSADRQARNQNGNTAEKPITFKVKLDIDRGEQEIWPALIKPGRNPDYYLHAKGVTVAHATILKTE